MNQITIQLPTKAEANNQVTEFFKFATVEEYWQELDELALWAISSELADNNPVERANRLGIVLKLKQILPCLLKLKE